MKKHSFISKFKSAFTLAEVLITLALIGIVTALTVPMLMQDIEARIMTDQVRMAKYKFTKACELMAIQNMMNRRTNTTDFVNNLSNYLKLIKVCDSSKLRQCWDYDEINLPSGSVINVATITSGDKLMYTQDSQNYDFTGPTVGIVTVDGLHAILAYNKKCKLKAQVYTWKLDSNKRPITSDAASCVAGVFDIDGDKIPNSIGDDVFLLNAEMLGDYINQENEDAVFLTTSDGNLQIPGETWAFTKPKKQTTGMNAKANCATLQNDYGVTYCTNAGTTDYWAQGVMDCGGKSKMISNTQAEKIVQRLAAKSPNGSLTANYLTAALGSNAAGAIVSSRLNFWTSNETNDTTATVYYANQNGGTSASAAISKATQNYLTSCTATIPTE